MLRNLLWNLWRKEAVVFIVVSVLLTAIVLQLHAWQSIPADKPLHLYSVLLDKADGIVSSWHTPIAHIGITLLLPFLFTLALRYLVIYVLLPGNKAGVVNALLDRCTEVSEVASARIEERLTEVAEWADGLRTGVDIDKQECPILGREIIERCRAKALFATCLQPPEKVYHDMRQFSEIVASEVRERHIALTRVIVTDVPLDQTNATVKWFVNLHRDGIQLRTISKMGFKNIAALYAIPPDRLDIMFFDGRVVYALLNAVESLAVYESDAGRYRLYLMDAPSKLQAYEKFCEALRTASQEIKPTVN
jgi:hypothetical protein